MMIIIYSSLIIASFILLYWKLFPKVKLEPNKKCILITGCDSGVGLSLAIFAQSLGLHVIAACLDLDSAGANLMKEKYPEILLIKVDVTNSGDVTSSREIVESYLLQTQSQLWCVVNNAGVLIYGQFDWQTESQMVNQIQVNLLGVMRVAKIYIPLLRKSGGRMINITSANGHWSLPGLSVYCATKHAIEGFSNCLRAEMITWGVKVILINPGNLPQSTRLLSCQSIHAAKMREALSQDDQEVYLDYFNHFQEYLQKNFSNLKNEQLKDDGLLAAFESAVFDTNPSHYYNNLTYGFLMFIQIFKILPAQWADKLALYVWGKSIGYDLI